MPERNPWTITKTLALSSGLLAICLGALFLGHAFGPTEAEVAQWGLLVVMLGAALTLTILVGGSSPKALTRAAAIGFLAALSLLQPLPIVLWFLFHETGISDGGPPAAFVADRAFALPHLLLLALSLAAAVRLLSSWKTTQGVHQQ